MTRVWTKLASAWSLRYLHFSKLNANAITNAKVDAAFGVSLSPSTKTQKSLIEQN